MSMWHCYDGLSGERFEVHDQDGYPDYSVWIPGRADGPLRVECKTVRDSEEAYRHEGEVTAYKVETQKTRASKEILRLLVVEKYIVL